MDKTSNSGLFESVGGFKSRLPVEGCMCLQKKKKKRKEKNEKKNEKNKIIK
jgi:hypothetical protein